MGIEPDQAQRLALSGEMIARTGDRADGDTVVATEHQRHAALAEAAFDFLAQGFTRREDRRLVTQLAGADLLGLRNHHVDVAAVDDLVSQRFEPLLEFRDAYRGRAHVNAAAARAEIHGNADNFDVALLGGHRTEDNSSARSGAET